MPDPQFEQVTTLADLAEGQPVAVTFSDGGPLCLVLVDGLVYAFADQCSHAEYALSDGEMVDDHVIECVLHGAQFDVRTGEAMELPATESLQMYEVEVEDGVVWVRRTQQ